jgi:hypothetical protein
MDELKAKHNNDKVVFAKQLGETFAMKAAASAGATAGIMIVLRITLPTCFKK